MEEKRAKEGYGINETIKCFVFKIVVSSLEFRWDGLPEFKLDDFLDFRLDDFLLLFHVPLLLRFVFFFMTLSVGIGSSVNWFQCWSTSDLALVVD